MKIAYFLFILALVSPITWAKNPNSNEAIEKAKYYMNIGQKAKARPLLEQEAKKNNPYALYWLGNLQILGTEQFAAGSTYQKAAELGSPWAMRLLIGGKGSYCNYMGWPCDKAWRDKIPPAFKKLADQGDGDALFAYYNYVKADYKPAKPGAKITNEDKIRTYRNIAIKSIEGGSYQFLKYKTPWRNNPQERIKYLKQFAKKGYAPASVQLAKMYDDKGDLKKSDYWYRQAILAGKGSVADSFHLAYMFGRPGKPKDIKKAYFYNQLAKRLKRGAKIHYRDMILWDFAEGKDGGFVINKETGGREKVWLIEPEEQKQIQQEVDQFIKDNHIVPNHFWDEFSLEFNP